MVIKIEAKSYGLGREEERGTGQHRDGVRAARNDVEMTQGSWIRRCRLPNLTLVPEETGALPLGGCALEGQGRRIHPSLPTSPQCATACGQEGGRYLVTGGAVTGRGRQIRRRRRRPRKADPPPPLPSRAEEG